jgi:pimeloyl-ACP methyl ester carboxylesterase
MSGYFRQDIHTQLAHSFFPSSRIVTIAGAGHFVHTEKQPQFIEALAAALA